MSNLLFFGPFTFETRGSLKLAKICAGAKLVEWVRGGWSRGERSLRKRIFSAHYSYVFTR